MPESGVVVPDNIKHIISELGKKHYIYAMFELKVDDTVKGNKMNFMWVEVPEGQKVKPSTLKPQDRLSREEVLEYYNEFCEKLSSDCSVYALFDFSLLEGNENLKVGVFQWCSDCLPVKKKMGFTSSLSGMKGLLTVGSHVFDAKERCDLDFDSVVDQLKSKK